MSPCHERGNSDDEEPEFAGRPSKRLATEDAVALKAALKGEAGEEDCPGTFECPICIDLMVEPTVASCGHDFCSHCLDAWLRRQGRSPRCPVCRAQLGSTLPGVCKRLAAEVEVRYPKTLAKRKDEVAVDILERQRLDEEDKLLRASSRSERMRYLQTLITSQIDANRSIGIHEHALQSRSMQERIHSLLESVTNLPLHTGMSQVPGGRYDPANWELPAGTLADLPLAVPSQPPAPIAGLTGGVDGMFPFTERHSLHHPPGYQTPSWLHPMGPVGQEAGVPATGFSFAQNSQAWRQPNGPHPLQQRPRPPSRGSTWRAPEVVETDTHAPWAEDLGSPTSLGSETSLESLSSPPTSQEDPTAYGERQTPPLQTPRFPTHPPPAAGRGPWPDYDIWVGSEFGLPPTLADFQPAPLPAAHHPGGGGVWLQNQPNQPSRSWIDADPYRPYARDGQFVPSRIQRATDPPPAAVVPGPQFAPPMDWLTGQPTFQEEMEAYSAFSAISGIPVASDWPLAAHRPEPQPPSNLQRQTPTQLHTDLFDSINPFLHDRAHALASDLNRNWSNSSTARSMASGAAELPPPEYMTFTMGSPHEPERGAGWSYYNASS